MSPKIVQWPRRRGQATHKASTCSWLLEVGQGPHYPAGQLRQPSQASPGLFPALASFTLLEAHAY